MRDSGGARDRACSAGGGRGPATETPSYPLNPPNQGGPEKFIQDPGLQPTVHLSARPSSREPVTPSGSEGRNPEGGQGPRLAPLLPAAAGGAGVAALLAAGAGLGVFGALARAPGGRTRGPDSPCGAPGFGPSCSREWQRRRLQPCEPRMRDGRPAAAQHQPGPAPAPPRPPGPRLRPTPPGPRPYPAPTPPHPTRAAPWGSKPWGLLLDVPHG